MYKTILRIEKAVTFNTAKGIFGFTESYGRRGRRRDASPKRWSRG